MHLAGFTLTVSVIDYTLYTNIYTTWCVIFHSFISVHRTANYVTSSYRMTVLQKIMQIFSFKIIRSRIILWYQNWWEIWHIAQKQLLIDRTGRNGTRSYNICSHACCMLCWLLLLVLVLSSCCHSLAGHHTHKLAVCSTAGCYHTFDIRPYTRHSSHA